MYEELEPIDSYDFDYQQFTHLKHEVIIKPGKSLWLKVNIEGIFWCVCVSCFSLAIIYSGTTDAGL